MKLPVDLRPQAVQDIREQGLYYLAQASPSAFARFHKTLRQALDLLAGQPELGERYESSEPSLAGVRIWRISGFSEHVIFYRPTPVALEVIRVLHGKRDAPPLLE